MNMLKDGVKFLTARQNASASESIIYKSGSRSYGPFNAVIAQTEMEEAEDVASEFISTIFDFIFRADLLAEPPKPGDRIITGGQTYEVMHGLAAGPWRFSDPYHIRYRVHTQHIGDA